MSVANGVNAVIGSGTTVSAASGYVIPTTAEETKWNATTTTVNTFNATVLSGIGATNVSQWDDAYSWGDHAGLYDANGTATATMTTHESTYDHDLIATALQDANATLDHVLSVGNTTTRSMSVGAVDASAVVVSGDASVGTLTIDSVTFDTVKDTVSGQSSTALLTENAVVDYVASQVSGGSVGDVTDVLAGQSITVTNSSGPQPTVAVTPDSIGADQLADSLALDANLTISGGTVFLSSLSMGGWMI